MSSLADYLAKNYLSADPPAKKSKKRKRKGTTEAATGGLIIADDDATGWDDGSSSGKRKDERDDRLRAPVTAGRTADFRRKKESTWQTLDAGETDQDGRDAADADAIIRSAAAENRALADADDDAPVVEGDVDMEDAQAEPERLGGLQTAEEVRAKAEKKRRAEKKRIEADVSGSSKQEDTIYRDASGRIINVAMKRAEARRAAEAEERKKREEAEAARGDVQNAMRDARKQDLEEAKYMTVARHADDVTMNEELKTVQRWNDPAAGFLTKPMAVPGSKGSGRKGPSQPTYQGAFEPNRYNIRPGYRWDGVDRSNGFEKKWFAARNKKKDRAELEYAWQMDE